jgi:hypothetical protein
MNEEEFCQQQRTRLRADYERAARPWIDRLTRIAATKAPRYFVLLPRPGSAEDIAKELATRFAGHVVDQMKAAEIRPVISEIQP